MMIAKMLREFRDDDSGAVTVDWVVLTAAIVGLSIGIGIAVANGVGGVTDEVEGDLVRASNNAVFENLATGAAAP